jgi:hypothetical protein
VRVANSKSGRSEPLVRGFEALDYDISADGRQVVMETADREGTPRLWLAPVDRSSPPQQIPRCGGRATHLVRAAKSSSAAPEGDSQAEGMEGSTGFVYRVRPDGTGMRKALETSDYPSVDGLAGRPVDLGMGSASRQRTPLWSGFPLDGKPPVPIGWIAFGWVPEGVIIEPFFVKRTYIVPRAPGQVLPRIPAGGFRSDHEIASPPRARRIDAGPVSPGPSPDIYAFYRGTTQRNLYRILIP